MAGMLRRARGGGVFPDFVRGHMLSLLYLYFSPIYILKVQKLLLGIRHFYSHMNTVLLVIYHHLGFLLISRGRKCECPMRGITVMASMI